MSAHTEKDQPTTGMLAYIVAAREVRPSSAEKKCLLQYYASNVNRNGKFFKSQVDICLETGLSKSFVQKTNKEWKTGGLLIYDPAKLGSGKANDYQLNLVTLRAMVKKSTSVPKEDTKIVKALKRAREKAAERQKRFRDNHRPVTPPESVTPESSVTPLQSVTQAA